MLKLLTATAAVVLATSAAAQAYRPNPLFGPMRRGDGIATPPPRPTYNPYDETPQTPRQPPRSPQPRLESPSRPARPHNPYDDALNPPPPRHYTPFQSAPPGYGLTR